MGEMPEEEFQPVFIKDLRKKKKEANTAVDMKPPSFSDREKKEDLPFENIPPPGAFRDEINTDRGSLIVQSINPVEVCSEDVKKEVAEDPVKEKKSSFANVSQLDCF